VFGHCVVLVDVLMPHVLREVVSRGSVSSGVWESKERVMCVQLDTAQLDWTASCSRETAPAQSSISPGFDEIRGLRCPI
jgi:hypothetical protein